MLRFNLKNAKLALAFSIPLFWASMASAEEIQAISLSAPGDVVMTAMDDFSPQGKPLDIAWHAVNLNGSDIVVTRIRKTRSADWLTAEGKGDTKPSSFTSDAYKPKGEALDMPEGALFAFRMTDASMHDLELKAGHHPSLIPVNQVLRQGWKANIQFHGANWSVFARYQRRSGGGLLAGSMELLYTDDKGNTMVVIPQAERMAFTRQEIVWLGDLHGGHCAGRHHQTNLDYRRV